MTDNILPWRLSYLYQCILCVLCILCINFFVFGGKPNFDHAVMTAFIIVTLNALGEIRRMQAEMAKK
jgi:hypothetical protein